MADSFPLRPILCFSCFQSEPSWLQGFTAEVMEIVMRVWPGVWSQVVLRSDREA